MLWFFVCPVRQQWQQIVEQTHTKHITIIITIISKGNRRGNSRRSEVGVRLRAIKCASCVRIVPTSSSGSIPRTKCDDFYDLPVSFCRRWRRRGRHFCHPAGARTSGAANNDGDGNKWLRFVSVSYSFSRLTDTQVAVAAVTWRQFDVSRTICSSSRCRCCFSCGCCCWWCYMLLQVPFNVWLRQLIDRADLSLPALYSSEYTMLVSTNIRLLSDSRLAAWALYPLESDAGWSDDCDIELSEN